MTAMLVTLRRFLAARSASFSLPVKLGVAFAAALLVGVLGLGIFSNQRAREQAIQAELATLNLLSERLAGQVDSFLSTTRSLAQNLALTQDTQQFLATRPSVQSTSAYTDWLDLQVQMTPGAAAIFVMAPDGSCLAASNRSFMGKNFKFRPYFQEAISGRPNTSDWFIGAVTRTPRVSSAAPIRFRDRIIGVLVVEYFVTEIERAIQTFGQGSRTAVLVNRHGISLAHNNPASLYHALEPLPAAVLDELEASRQFLGRHIPVEKLSETLPEAFHLVLKQQIPHTVRYQLGGLAKWGTLHPVKGQVWVVSVSEPEAEILLPAQALWRQTILVGLLSAGGAFLVSLLLVRTLLRPLQDFTSAISAFGHGDASARAPLRTHWELQALASTFNAMADTIQNHQENLENLVQQRTRDLEQALGEMKRLQGMIPICSYCKKIRDDGGSWWQLESYIQTHSEAEFSHGICPECRGHHFPGVPTDPKADPSGS